MGMKRTRMTPARATKIVKDLKANNFDQKKTLLDNGYSETTATHNSGRAIRNAHETVKRALDLPEDKSIQDTADLLEVVGITQAELLNEYKSIIEQNINLAVKLRAMEPLLRTKSIKWDSNEEQKVPPVNISISPPKEKDTIEEIEAKEAEVVTEELKAGGEGA
jgi:hypothetical protein